MTSPRARQSSVQGTRRARRQAGKWGRRQVSNGSHSQVPEPSRSSSWCGPATRPAASGRPPLRRIAQRLKRNGPGLRSWHELVEQRFAHLALGLFDVRVPHPPQGQQDPEDTSAALVALLTPRTDGRRGCRAHRPRRAGRPAGEVVAASPSRPSTAEPGGRRHGGGRGARVRTALEQYRTEQRKGRSSASTTS